MSSDVAIKLQNVSKCFYTYNHPADRLRQMGCRGLSSCLGTSSLAGSLRKQAEKYGQQFWALKDISFEIKAGQTVGILGQNGAGKSTLLQIITKTLTQTSGNVYTRGKIAALLELGSGFNHDFTGMENVYLNAALLGLNRDETTKHLDRILEFADIGSFIHEPVKSYSSGMVVRLAFAVQAQLEPDILIVDEALSVGDVKFQAKCFARLHELVKRGTTVLFVSHSTEQIVTHCDSAILLSGGEVSEIGEPKNVVNHYLDQVFGKKKGTISNPLEHKSSDNDKMSGYETSNQLTMILNGRFSERHGYNHHEYRWGDKSAEISDFLMESKDGVYPNSLESGERAKFIFQVLFHKNMIKPIFGFTLKTKEGVTIYGINTELQEIKSLEDAREGETRYVKIDIPMKLAAGDYFISVGVASREMNGEIIPHDRRYDSIHLVINPTPLFFGIVNMEAQFKDV